MSKVHLNHFFHRIQGWPNELPRVYQQIVAAAPQEGAHFVEVGCWKGASAAFMCVEIVNSGKQIRFDCVDTWGGSADNSTPIVNDDSVYNEFLKNLEPVTGYFNPVRMLSTEAAKLYEDNSLDFVCIDASHDYENVKLDILAWLPKVKSGCILAGDDYPYPGVTQAVNELLPGFNHSTAAWWWTKP